MRPISTFVGSYIRDEKLTKMFNMQCAEWRSRTSFGWRLWVFAACRAANEKEKVIFCCFCCCGCMPNARWLHHHNIMVMLCSLTMQHAFDFSQNLFHSYFFVMFILGFCCWALQICAHFANWSCIISRDDVFNSQEWIWTDFYLFFVFCFCISFRCRAAARMVDVIRGMQSS